MKRKEWDKHTSERLITCSAECRRRYWNIHRQTRRLQAAETRSSLDRRQRMLCETTSRYKGLAHSHGRTQIRMKSHYFPLEFFLFMTAKQRARVSRSRQQQYKMLSYRRETALQGAL